MMHLYTLSCIILSLLITKKSNGISSPLQPYTSYRYSTELQRNVADLWWTVNETRQEITFELHIKTTGWIALGISPAGGMKGADIGLGWIDQGGQVHFQDRHANGFSRPVIDNTTTDWFALQGREQNGWTAIQFKRSLDTCDKMDVSIKSGTNTLIFAYGLEDSDISQPDGLIYYHDSRRGSRIVPLRSYGNPPSEEKFADLDYFEFKLNNYVVPAIETTYYCKVYKAPTNFRQRRHAIARNIMVDSNNRDIVHHVVLFECNPTAVFDDNNLPEGICDEITRSISSCTVNIATVWAVGGDEITTYRHILFDLDRHDNSGVRFYLGKELRQYELGYLILGADVSHSAIAIPPETDRFILDSYCPAEATQNFPEPAITVLAAFPHTHLQGRLIRNNKVVKYLFNAESYNFNYQFENLLPKPIELYPGDEFATRCVYSTTNKTDITLGGERTKDEMCLHYFLYYPRMKNYHGCLSLNSKEAWKKVMNSSESTFDYEKLGEWLKRLKWTPESVLQWQKFYNDAPRSVVAGLGDNFKWINLTKIPEYEDLKPVECKTDTSNFGIHQD
ncbi:unnamed protein product [Rotaria sp. Silwood2]|nr:unnamed protein product [Rotaria sp. Silwood2]